MAPVFVKRYGGGKGKVELYGLKIDQSQNAVTIEYIEDNENYIPAGIDGVTGAFDYGSWADAFFMQIRPCMLKYDGTVDYYLDPNDYTKKTDGSASDIVNVSYAGNAMIEFPRSYYKIVDNGDGTANVYVCNQKLDDDFFCWSFLDSAGNEIDYCYMSIYPCSVYDNRLRCLSGKNQYINNSLKELIGYARNNDNIGNAFDWCIEVYCDVLLLQIYAVLISRTADSQEAFGYGPVYVSSISNNTYGNLNDKGLFYGKSLSNSSIKDGGGFKFFGIENYWSYKYRIVAGVWMTTGGNNYVKMTHSTKDGTAVEGYLPREYGANNGGGGYKYISQINFSSDNVISKMMFSPYGFFVKEVLSMSENNMDLGYKDRYYMNSSSKYGIPCYGGASLSYNTPYKYILKHGGIFSLMYESKLMTSNFSGSNYYSCRLSCKPRKNKEN